MKEIPESNLIESDPSGIHPSDLAKLAARLNALLLCQSPDEPTIDLILKVADDVKLQKKRELIKSKIEGLSIRDLNVLIDALKKLNKPTKTKGA